MLYIKLFIEREKNTGQSAPECPFKGLSHDYNWNKIRELENGRRRVHVGTGMADTDSMLAYGQRVPPCGRVDIASIQTSGGTTGHRDKVKT